MGGPNTIFFSQKDWQKKLDIFKIFIVEKIVRFNTIFKNTSVLLVEKICDLLQVTGRWPTLSYSVVSSTPLIIGNDYISKSDYHAIMATTGTPMIGHMSCLTDVGCVFAHPIQ